MSTKILSNDIELRTSERMTDAEDGGGEMAGTIVQNNMINQVFSPISSADRDVGRISLRQLYLHVNTLTDDTYYGANVIIETPPEDTTVEMLLFDPNIPGASRAQAKAYVESYIAVGPRSRMQPIGTQSAGQGQVLAYQTPGQPLPEVGEVFVLSVETGASAGTTQSIKITNVAASEETFYYAGGSGVLEYKCTQLLLTISQPLDNDFPGADPTPLKPGNTWIRRTTTNASAKYCGVTNLSAAADIGDVEIQVASIQKQLVPSVSSQNVISNARIGSSVNTISAGSHNVEVTNAAHASRIAISTANVGTSFIKTLRPFPVPGSVVVSYRSAGIWYSLYDDGLGSLVGDSSNYGSGAINYGTGTAVVTLGTEPDIGSQVLFTWGSPTHYEVSTAATINKPRMFINLGTTEQPEEIEPGTLSVTYKKSTVDITVTASSAGEISNADVTGYANHRLGTVLLEWNIVPDSGSSLSIEYDHATNFVETLHQVAWEGATAGISFTLNHTNIKPRTLSFAWKSEAKYGPGRYHIPNSFCS